MERYAGTRLGRQELDGELIEDDPDALFRARADRASQGARGCRNCGASWWRSIRRRATRRRANACGIVCAGLGDDGRVYVLDDASAAAVRGPRNGRTARWRSITARKADRVVAEVNQGGAMVERCCARWTETWPSGRSMRGAASAPGPSRWRHSTSRGGCRHVGRLPRAGGRDVHADRRGGSSPDRLDALVWAVSDLMLQRRPEPRVRDLI